MPADERSVVVIRLNLRRLILYLWGVTERFAQFAEAGKVLSL